MKPANDSPELSSKLSREYNNIDERREHSDLDEFGGCSTEETKLKSLSLMNREMIFSEPRQSDLKSNKK